MLKVFGSRLIGDILYILKYIMEPEIHINEQGAGNEKHRSSVAGEGVSVIRCEEDSSDREDEKEKELVEAEKPWLRGEICRICHLGSEVVLIQLGCGCKDELGVSHLLCAQTWFKQKGNRLCEICGKIAGNVSGVEDTRILMVEWNEMRLMASNDTISAFPEEGSDSNGCKRNLCNILLACLVLAFVIPWFFRINML